MDRGSSRRSRGASPACLWLGVGALAALGALAFGPFLVPVRRPEGLVEADELADADSRFADVGGVRIHYKVSGDPKSPCAIVFLHGFASSQYSWRHAMAALSPRARVVAFDRPGFGLSARPLAGDWTGESPYSMESAARQTVGLMDELGIRRAVLVGHSQGAAISLMVADMFPDRVSALVMVSAPTASRRFRPRPYLDWVRRLPQVRHLAPLVPRPFFGRHAKRFMSMAYADPQRLTDETVALETKAARVRDWDLSYVELTSVQTGFHNAEAMARVAVPTLLVAGEKDHTVPYRDQLAAAAAIPGARIITFYDTGHVVPEERPGALAEVIDDFLDDQDC